MKIRSVLCVTSALALAAVASSCSFNVFDFIDSPGGDAQLISAARAALDRGDYDQAVEYYQKLSGDAGDVAVSEQAFALLARHNVGMGAFASAFGTGGGGAGKAITAIANTIGTGASVDTRADIFLALDQTKKITKAESVSLRGLVRFLSAIALIAETMAEVSVDPTHVLTSDLALNPTACSSTPTSCGIANVADCGPSTHNPALTQGSAVKFDLTAATAETVRANGPTLSLIAGAIDQIDTALLEIQSSGSLSGSVGSFTGALAEGALATTDGSCYRAALINEAGLGSY